MKILSLMILLVTVNTEAKLSRASSPSGGNSFSGDTVTSSASQSSSVEVEEDDSKKCDSQGRHIPFEFMHDVVMPNFSDMNINVDENNKTAEVYIPEYYSACLKTSTSGKDDISFDYTLNENNIYVRAKISEDFNEADYIKCLKDKKLLNKEGQFSPYGKTKTELGTKNARIQTINLGSLNFSKDIGIYLEDPPPTTENGRYGPVYSKKYSTSPNSCYKKHNFKKNGRVAFKSHETSLKDEAVAVCSTDDIEKMNRMLSQLETSTAGNAQYLIAFMKENIGRVTEERQEKVLERMAKINEMLQPTPKDLSEGREVGKKEKQAANLIKEFAALAKELDDLAIAPAARELAALMDAYEDADEDEKDAIEEKIEKLNEQAGSLSEIDHKWVIKAIEHYALVKKGERIAGYLAKSELLSRVYPGREDSRGDQLEFDEVSDELSDSVDYFNEVKAPEWVRIYKARNGDDSAVREARKEMQMAMMRAQNIKSSHARFEQQKTKELCGRNMLGMVKNPYGCQEWTARAPMRQMMVQESYGSALQDLRAMGDSFSTINRLYARSMVERREQQYFNEDPYGIFGRRGSSYNYSRNPMQRMGMFDYDMGSTMSMGMDYSMMGAGAMPVDPMAQYMASSSRMSGRMPATSYQMGMPGAQGAQYQDPMSMMGMTSPMMSGGGMSGMGGNFIGPTMPQSMPGNGMMMSNPGMMSMPPQYMR